MKDLEKIGLPFKGALWFLVAVVAPLSVWFAALKFEMGSAYARIDDMEQEQTRQYQKLEAFQDRTSDRLDEINKRLGEVCGELRRIQTR